jgi:hypothetical protein
MDFIGRDARPEEDDPSEPIRVERTYPVFEATRRRWRREREEWLRTQREEDGHGNATGE